MTLRPLAQFAVLSGVLVLTASVAGADEYPYGMPGVNVGVPRVATPVTPYTYPVRSVQYAPMPAVPYTAPPPSVILAPASPLAQPAVPIGSCSTCETGSCHAGKDGAHCVANWGTRTVVKREYTCKVEEYCNPCDILAMFKHGCNCSKVHHRKQLVLKLKTHDEPQKQCKVEHGEACDTCGH
jgi:hypothetical protein